MSTNAVVSVVIGGAGTLTGAVYGSILLVIIKSIIGSWTEHQLLIIGALFMCSTLFFPRGLMGLVFAYFLMKPAAEQAITAPVSSVVSVSGEVK